MLLFSAEENGGAKDALKALNDPPVVVSVLGELEIVEELRRTRKTDRTAFLTNG
jgi:hypothetical protein